MGVTLKQLGIFQTADVYWKSIEDAVKKKYNEQQVAASVEVLSDFCDTLDRSGVILLQVIEQENSEIAPPVPAPAPEPSPLEAEAFPEEELMEELDEDTKPAIAVPVASTRPPAAPQPRMVRQAPLSPPAPQAPPAPSPQEQRKASFIERMKMRKGG